jgi:hypothetical protein
MSLFIESVYNEREDEVATDIERLKAIATDMHSKVELNTGEAGLFRDGIDPALVVGLVEKYTDGVVHDWSSDTDIDKFMLEVSQCLEMLRKSLCK